MSRHVDTGSTDQSIVFWAFDSSGAAVQVTTSDSVSWRRDNNGREGSPVSMSLVTRLVSGQHRDNAITYKGNGKHEIDLPDAAVATAGEVTLQVTKSGVTSVYVEKLEVSAATGSGTGARTVTITVNDGTTALQNARVRLTEGANTFTAQTNASGVATFNVDDATYVVSITKAGYSYSGTTLVVNGTEAETYSMTAISITPSTGDQTTGYLTTLDETGAAEAGVSIYVSVADVPNDYGLALDEATRTVVSNNAGLVEITGMVKGATYNLRRGLKGRLYAVTIPTSAGSTYELPNMAGV